MGHPDKWTCPTLPELLGRENPGMVQAVAEIAKNRRQKAVGQKSPVPLLSSAAKGSAQVGQDLHISRKGSAHRTSWIG